MISTMIPLYISMVAAVLGVFSHLGIFIRGEWHMMAPNLMLSYSCLTLVLICSISSSGVGARTSLKYTAILVASYCIALFTSIVVYRKFFHRLRQFPGPFGAGITKLWHVWKCRGSGNHLLIEELRQIYGPVIRTGPEELTIIDPSLPAILDGPGNHFEKAVWYDVLLPELAINTTRNKKAHDLRRRIWDRGFNSKALTVYNERIIQYTQLLASRIEKLSRTGQPVVVTDWFYWYTFDVMGEFAFARSFGMLRDEQWHVAVRMLRKAMALLGPFSPVPWLIQIGFRLTWIPVVRDWFAMVRWCRERMDERLTMEVTKPDVSHWLIEASREHDLNNFQAHRRWLNGDAIAMIIAGSDTVAPTLVFAFYELARDSSRQAQLFDELKDVDICDARQLEHCEYLNAIIKETLRLHPAVPTNGYRQSPSTGMTVNGLYIPGNVTVVSPRYSIARLESCYEQADTWIPERWTVRPELVKDARGYSPFSQGRYSCVGKALALMELRSVVALLIAKFSIGLLEENSGKDWFPNLSDQFTASPERLELRFDIRL